MMNEAQQEIRGIQPLEGEGPWLILHERHGLLDQAPPEEDCLLLSNLRLIGLSQGEGRRRSTLLSLQDVDVVEITDISRSLKPLVTGGLMVLSAVVLAWLAAAFDVAGFLPWLIGGTLVLLGAITASTYFVAEETAMITFRNRTTEVSLPLLTPLVMRDAHTMVHRFFQAKAGQAPTADQDTAPLQEHSGPETVDDAPAPEAESYPQEFPQADPTEQPADAPLPGVISYQPESTQAEGWRDV